MDLTLFDETELAGLALKNRLFRSATYLGLCKSDGTFGDDLLQLYRELAEGGVAVVITELTDVCGRDNALGDNMRLHDDALIAHYARLVDIVHEQGALVFPQLNMNRYLRAVDHAQGVGASVSPQGAALDVGDLSVEDIADIVQLFADAAVRAQACGFDGVQLHAAYGWLLNRFLNPAFNHRDDAYGGSVSNRARLVCEIIGAIKEALPGFPVGAKLSFYAQSGEPGAQMEFDSALSADDMVNRFYAVEEGAQLCALMRQSGLDFVEVVGDHSPLERGTAYDSCYLALARAVRATTDVPVVLTGSNLSLDTMEEALEDDGIEYFGLSRALIREPDLPNRWLSGDETGARCVHCDRCYKTPMKRCSYVLRARGEW